MTKRKIQYWVIPPKSNSEFVAHMEHVLALYAQPYDPMRPVVCMDEQPVQLIGEVQAPIPATATTPKRVDYEYTRAGVANIFLFTEPLAGWRTVGVRPTKTRVDWATEVAALLDGRFVNGEVVTLVCDNLNTHSAGSFYESFDPARARAYLDRLVLRHTPKHGSWLNIAENELSAMTRQCTARRRFPTIESLESETQAWAIDCNRRQKGVRWHFTIEKARAKLASLYPTMLV